MKSILAILLMLFSLKNFAAGVWHTSTVDSVYLFAPGSLAVNFNTDSSSCPNTSSPKNYYVTVGQNGVTQEAQNKMYSALIAAGMAGKDVKIYFEDSSTGCYINRVLVYF